MQIISNNGINYRIYHPQPVLIRHHQELREELANLRSEFETLQQREVWASIDGEKNDGKSSVFLS